MKISEKFALNEWLSDYPENLDFDAVLDLLRDEDLSVIVWQWFENMPAYELIENIENTRSHFDAVTAPILAALHAALDDADDARAAGYPDPAWADQARKAVAT